MAERLGRPLVGRVRRVRPRDCRRRPGRPRGRGVRRLGRAADAAARPARARRPGRHQFPHRELPRVSRRRQRQRADAPRGDAGAAARRGVPRAARSRPGSSIDAGYKRTRARRRPRDRHAHPAGRDRHGLPRASRAGHGGAHGRGRVLRRGHDGGAGVRGPARGGRRRRQLGRTGRDVPVALRDGRADRGAPRVACATPCRSTSSSRSTRRRTSGCGPGTEIERVEGSGHVERVAFTSPDDGTSEVEDIDAVFVFIGTRPRSDWLPAGRAARRARVRADRPGPDGARRRTRASGRRRASRCRSRPACPACSRPATSAPAR